MPSAFENFCDYAIRINEAQEWAAYVARVNAVEAAKAASKKNLPKSPLRHLTPRSVI